MKDLLRQLLFRSLDEDLSEAEAKQLAEGLTRHEDLKNEQKDLLKMREALADLREAPDPIFTQAVMSKIGQRYSTVARINRLWPAVAAACVLAVSVGLTYILLSEGSLNNEALIGLEDDLMPEEVYVFGEDY